MRVFNTQPSRFTGLGDRITGGGWPLTTRVAAGGPGFRIVAAAPPVTGTQSSFGGL
jgi:hypothetical protein